MSETLPKQLLHPVSVPWEVSASTSFLRLCAVESELPTEVTFVGHFGLEHTETDDESLSADLPKIVSQAGLEAALNVHKLVGPYQLVRLVFPNGSWARLSPAYSGREVVKEDDYDWSEIAFITRARTDLRAAREEFWTDWRATALCPDPGMYEVLDSRWSKAVHGDYRNYNHYLIMGHDAYVDVLATGWRWESLGALRGW